MVFIFKALGLKIMPCQTQGYYDRIRKKIPSNGALRMPGN